MADLFARPTTRAELCDRDRTRLEKAKRAAQPIFRGTVTPPLSRITHSLGTFGNGGNLSAEAEPVQKSALDHLPENIRTVAVKHVLPADAAELLHLVATRSAKEGGAPMSFSGSEVAVHLGISRERADAMIRLLEQRSLLIERRNRAGASEGFTVSLT